MRGLKTADYSKFNETRQLLQSHTHTHTQIVWERNIFRLRKVQSHPEKTIHPHKERCLNRSEQILDGNRTSRWMLPLDRKLKSSILITYPCAFHVLSKLYAGQANYRHFPTPSTLLAVGWDRESSHLVINCETWRWRSMQCQNRNWNAKVIRGRSRDLFLLFKQSHDCDGNY